LLNGSSGAYRDTILLNTAAALIVAGKTISLEDGVRLAVDAIDSGRAKAVLEALVAATQQELV
jgi:anthranilate phosphoribosyltransferase